VKAEERKLILGDAVLPETPRDRSGREGIEEDLRSSPLRGRRLALRLRNFRPAADGYLAALGGPLPYMVRLREIEEQTSAHRGLLAEAWHGLARSTRDDDEFARAWAARVASWSFDEVNDLIDRHNRFYPAESRLPMDPQRGDHALVNGEDYRRRPLDAAWALERFPADRERALTAR
jgi:hypothetical protein